MVSGGGPQQSRADAASSSWCGSMVLQKRDAYAMSVVVLEAAKKVRGEETHPIMRDKGTTMTCSSPSYQGISTVSLGHHQVPRSDDRSHPICQTFPCTQSLYQGQHGEATKGYETVHHQIA